MEGPLEAREFLRRFHLPQLVRLAQAPSAARPEPAPPAASRDWAAPEVELAPARASGSHEASHEWTFSRPAAAARARLSQRQRISRAQLEECLANRKLSQPLGSVRVPRASLAAPAGSFGKRSVGFTPAAADDSVQPCSRRDQNTGAGGLEASSRLAPVSRRPMLCKLQLDQPFLLYKAFKKLELCAYLLDPTNELSDKSGDPIFLPHDYPGWFSLMADRKTRSGEQAEHLESLDEVCRSGFQVFMSQDEIVGYEMPRELSHLTKLDNNQILALPLAINLEPGRKRGSSSSSSSSSSGLAAPTASAGDSAGAIKRIAIKRGQIMKISGIYEDVMPLMERRQQQLSAGQAPPASGHKPIHQLELETRAANCELYYQLAPALAASEYLATGRQPAGSSGAPELVARGPLGEQAPWPPTMSAENRYTAGSSIYHSASQQPLVYQLARPAKSCRSQGHTLGASGQRYVRCALLGERSLERLTDSLQQQDNSPIECQPTRQAERALAADEQEPEEREVLIPIEQLGRFYLCATKQLLAGELSRLLCSGYSLPRSMILKLSHIIYLLNVSRTWSARRNCTLPAQGGRPSAPIDSGGAPRHHFRLPMDVHLVCGPKPARFSPTMFGPNAAGAWGGAPSYLGADAHVHGHLLECALNRNSALWARAATAGSVGAAGSPPRTCRCGDASDARDSAASGDFFGGFFSAVLRIERLSRRDVLLACTIKQDPLQRLELAALPGAAPEAAAGERALSAALQAMAAPHSAAARCGAPAGSRSGAMASLGKSSLGRLRACRSLMSLNGRRKSRPKIPVGLLAAPDAAERLGAAEGASAGRPRAAGSSGAGHGAAKLELTAEARESDPCRVVLVEFDCDEPQLRFVRTFVDSSLPASSIPDLVLSRMQFCHRNSPLWERHLKLSCATLARDFDSCSQQLERSRLQRLARSAPPDAAPDALQDAGATEAAKLGAAPAPAARWHAAHRAPSSASARYHEASTSSHSSSSTASSRSSSGVSSAAAGSRARAASGCSNSLSSTGAKRTGGGAAGRLVRLMQRLLPSPAASGAGSPPDASERRVATLMNAQRIHRRLLRAEARSSPAEEGSTKSGSHLYESLERLPASPLRSGEPAGHRMGRSLDFLAGASPAPARDRRLLPSADDLKALADECHTDLASSNSSQSELDWWCSSTSGRGRADRLEPISFEQADPMLERQRTARLGSLLRRRRSSDDHDDDHHNDDYDGSHDHREDEEEEEEEPVSEGRGGGGRSEERRRGPKYAPTEAEADEDERAGESIYVNLVDADGQPWRQWPAGLRAGRMERKLMRLRGR